MKDKSKYGTESYFVKPKSNANCLTREMIEGLVEEEIDLIPKFGEYSNNEPLDIPTMTTEFVKEHGLPCPEGYEFKDENGNVINTTKIVLEKKKKEYPKTYEECCKVLMKYTNTVPNVCGVSLEEFLLFSKLIRLKRCREAYWKIAREEMGLDKPWEPATQDIIWGITRSKDEVEKYSCRYGKTNLLEFPTEEMRDAFYENFKDLIEQCKELL